MKNKYIIIGRTGSGKDTLAELLQQKEETLIKAKTYTERPPREHEKDGNSSHIFITKNEMDDIYRDYKNTIMKTTINNVRYATTLQILEESDILITDPTGLKDLIYYTISNHQIRNIFEKLTLLYIHADDEVLKSRYLLRGQTEEDHYLRSQGEEEQFRTFEEILEMNYSESTFGNAIEEDSIFWIGQSLVTFSDIMESLGDVEDLINLTENYEDLLQTKFIVNIIENNTNSLQNLTKVVAAIDEIDRFSENCFSTDEVDIPIIEKRSALKW